VTTTGRVLPAADRLMHETAALLRERFRPVERVSLRDFTREAWSSIRPGEAFGSSWHIDAICDHLEAAQRREIKRLRINIPPRHMKTLTTSVFFPAWTWTHSAAESFLFAHYSQNLAEDAALDCRDLLQSEWYRARWGGRVALSQSQATKLNFRLRAGARRDTTSVGGTATGKGAGILVIDDPLNVADSFSRAVRDATNRYVRQTLMTRLNDPKTGVIVLMMQRVHEDDPCGHLRRLEEEMGGDAWEDLVLPAEYDPRRTCYIRATGWRDPRTVEGELLWPQRFDADAISRLKIQLGEYGTAGQLQQHPVPVAGGLFKRAWFRFFESLPTAFDYEWQYWDLSFKGSTEEAGRSKVVGLHFGAIGGDVYILDEARGGWDFVETQREMLAFRARHPRTMAVLVEDKANGPAILSTLSALIPGLVADPVEGDKAARAYAVSPLVQAGHVYLPREADAPWVTDFLEEICLFDRGPHDDRVDAMGGGLRYWMRTFQPTQSLRAALGIPTT
jgi:predicted phage terminase large subunit-like protein